MLTGDKLETAMSIGYSSGLINENMSQFIVDGTTPQMIESQLVPTNYNIKHNLTSISKGYNQEKAMIIDGAAITTILTQYNLKNQFVQSVKKADVFIVSRCTPMQKAEIVELVQKRFPDKNTLAIGDGFNDVSMLLEA
jgi:phospholipid-transporting ATPase